MWLDHALAEGPGLGQRGEEGAQWDGRGGCRWSLTAEPAALYLRHPGGLENGVFCVRDVSTDEDRLPGRQIGYGLSRVRTAAFNVLRTLGFAFIPDARRYLAARPDLGLSLLRNRSDMRSPGSDKMILTRWHQVHILVSYSAADQAPGLLWRLE